MVNEVSVIALYAMAITNYIGYFFQLSPVTCKIVGTVIIVCAALFNIFGVKSGSGITSGLTVAKLLGLSVVIVGGLFLAQRQPELRARRFRIRRLGRCNRCGSPCILCLWRL